MTAQLDAASQRMLVALARHDLRDDEATLAALSAPDAKIKVSIDAGGRTVIRLDGRKVYEVDRATLARAVARLQEAEFWERLTTTSAAFIRRHYAE